jgi:hypothetical protein
VVEALMTIVAGALAQIMQKVTGCVMSFAPT